MSSSVLDKKKVPCPIPCHRPANSPTYRSFPTTRIDIVPCAKQILEQGHFDFRRESTVTAADGCAFTSTFKDGAFNVLMTDLKVFANAKLEPRVFFAQI